jgi:hypothetical protein
MGFIINPYHVQPGVPAFTGILDTYTGAAAAYSTARRLATAYTGALIRVRRSSDNTEQDIGYDSNNKLDESALTSFVGANNGFVVKWYDQSGSGNDATNSTASKQPQIVSSGTIIKTSGNIISMSCYRKTLPNTQSNASIQATFIASECSSTGNDLFFALPYCTISAEGSGTYAGIAWDGINSSPDSNFGTPTYYKNDSSISSTRNSIWDNYTVGDETIMNVIGGGTTTSNRYTQYDTSNYSGNFKLFEVIIYNSDQSSNRSGINTNINTFYSIY